VKRRDLRVIRKRPCAAGSTAPLAMPHERDESPEQDLPHSAVVEQAHRDVTGGLVDTDNYTRTAANAAPGSLRRGGVRRRGR
jgi:hypothetical protein